MVLASQVAEIPKICQRYVVPSSESHFSVNMNEVMDTGGSKYVSKYVQMIALKNRHQDDFVAVYSNSYIENIEIYVIFGSVAKLMDGSAGPHLSMATRSFILCHQQRQWHQAP